MSSVNQPNSPITTPSDDLVRQLALMGIPAGSYSLKPLDGLRKLIARRMVESVQTAPHFSLSIRVETDRLITLRAELNEGAETRITVNDLFIKASALALVECPQVNSSFTNSGIITHHHADVSFAVAMEGGLVTPIVRRADAKTIREIAAETRDLAERGRRKRLRPEEYSGGTFTVSNLGMFGIASFDAIINQPQAAILSVGAPERTYMLDGETPRIASVMTATLTSDHRVVDGATAAAWLNVFKRAVENPSAWAAGQ